jgi:hypothetical protein
MLPVYSSRYRDLFAYGQMKAEVRTGIGLFPYASVRFVGDTRGMVGGVSPQYLSEGSFIFGFGVRTSAWHGMLAWGEVGRPVSYRGQCGKSDYRGGISASWAGGARSSTESGGWFRDTAIDGVFLSRFGNDFLVYEQGRFGYTTRQIRGAHIELYMNGNATLDVRREQWANFLETGPGIRLNGLPREGVRLGVDILRGRYVTGARGYYSDVRVGIWYAFSR